MTNHQLAADAAQACSEYEKADGSYADASAGDCTCAIGSVEFPTRGRKSGCPHCGRCPWCDRPYDTWYPQYPPYQPYNPPYRPYNPPYWWNHVICDTKTVAYHTPPTSNSATSGFVAIS